MKRPFPRMCSHAAMHEHTSHFRTTSAEITPQHTLLEGTGFIQKTTLSTPPPRTEPCTIAHKPLTVPIRSVACGLLTKPPNAIPADLPTEPPFNSVVSRRGPPVKLAFRASPRCVWLWLVWLWQSCLVNAIHGPRKGSVGGFRVTESDRCRTVFPRFLDRCGCERCSWNSD